MKTSCADQLEHVNAVRDHRDCCLDGVKETVDFSCSAPELFQITKGRVADVRV